MAQTDTTGQLSWLLDNLVSQVEHVQQALILSRDGLVVAASQGLTREDGEHLSALAAGVQSLARGTGRHFRGGEVRQTIIEMETRLPVRHRGGQGDVPGGADLRGAERGPHRLRDGDARPPHGQVPRRRAEIP